jgi:hypothetical protein
MRSQPAPLPEGGTLTVLLETLLKSYPMRAHDIYPTNVVFWISLGFDESDGYSP